MQVDSIAKVFAAALSVALTSVVSYMAFSQPLEINSALSFIINTSAMVLYYMG